MEVRDGKLYIDAEDLADMTRDLVAFADDPQSAEELRRGAREASARAADPSRPPVVLKRVCIGGTAKIPTASALNRILSGPTNLCKCSRTREEHPVSECRGFSPAFR